MKIKLVAPHEHGADAISSPFPLQRVNLPLLAALTPPDHAMTIVEESFAPDDMNGDADLVGITVMTELAQRAYKIGDTYRQKGVKVVMGGIHPTVLPDEALQHADAVVVGEAEGVWPQPLADAAADRCKEYIGPVKCRSSKVCRNHGEISHPKSNIRGIFPSRSASRHPEGVRTIANSAALAGFRGGNIESGRFQR